MCWSGTLRAKAGEEQPLEMETVQESVNAVEPPAEERECRIDDPGADKDAMTGRFN